MFGKCYITSGISSQPHLFLVLQVNQLGAAAQKYQTATQNAPSNISVPELQNNCNMLVFFIYYFC